MREKTEEKQIPARTTEDVQSGRKSEGIISELFKVGAHFGFVKSRRHPSAKSFIFGSKNDIEIFDLEKTSVELSKALEFVEKKGEEGAIMLFVGGKNEARMAVTRAGQILSMPYVAGRWIGGTLTNFPEIKKRIARLDELTGQKERGELGKYTKKERLLIDRDIERLNHFFGGLTILKSIPKVMVVIDPKKEQIAVAEAHKLHIPIVALAGSDSNLHDVEYAIPANDSSRQSIELVLEKIASAYKTGLETGKKKDVTEVTIINN
ncbi:MAG: 30S ribosomal protein S2 [bacterium]